MDDIQKISTKFIIESLVFLSLYPVIYSDFLFLDLIHLTNIY